jgi:hypothetical protein
MPTLPEPAGTSTTKEKTMKSLFLSMAIVGAVTLWYSNAQANDFRYSHGKQSSHQVQNPSRHSGYGYSRHQRWEHSDGYRRASFDSGINRRQFEQQLRIGQASRTGALTRDERKSLWSEQRAIATEERQYRSDGRFTREERQDLHKDLALASQHIYNESHDADRRQYRR